MIFRIASRCLACTDQERKDSPFSSRIFCYYEYFNISLWKKEGCSKQLICQWHHFLWFLGHTKMLGSTNVHHEVNSGETQQAGYAFSGRPNIALEKESVKRWGHISFRRGACILGMFEIIPLYHFAYQCMKCFSMKGTIRNVRSLSSQELSA